VFGGSSFNGSVKGEVFCCEFNEDEIRDIKKGYKEVIEEI
jgi:hypothetical protein